MSDGTLRILAIRDWANKMYDTAGDMKKTQSRHWWKCPVEPGSQVRRIIRKHGLETKAVMDMIYGLAGSNKTTAGRLLSSSGHPLNTEDIVDALRFVTAEQVDKTIAILVEHGLAQWCSTHEEACKIAGYDPSDADRNVHPDTIPTPSRCDPDDIPTPSGLEEIREEEKRKEKRDGGRGSAADTHWRGMWRKVYEAYPAKRRRDPGECETRICKAAERVAAENGMLKAEAMAWLLERTKLWAASERVRVAEQTGHMQYIKTSPVWFGKRSFDEDPATWVADADWLPKPKDKPAPRLKTADEIMAERARMESGAA